MISGQESEYSVCPHFTLCVYVCGLKTFHVVHYCFYLWNGKIASHVNCKLFRVIFSKILSSFHLHLLLFLMRKFTDFEFSSLHFILCIEILIIRLCFGRIHTYRQEKFIYISSFSNKFVIKNNGLSFTQLSETTVELLMKQLAVTKLLVLLFHTSIYIKYTEECCNKETPGNECEV